MEIRMSLKPEIIQFYKDNGYRLSDFFDPKRHRGVKLTKAQVKAGAELYYKKLKSGELGTPKRISYGWGIIEQAKAARFDEFVKDEELLRQSKDIIGGLEVKKARWVAAFWTLALSVGIGVVWMAKTVGIIG